MMNELFPCGQVIEFHGNIDWLYKLDYDFAKSGTYWVGDAFVETKNDLHKPYLQVNHLGKAHGLENQRCISPNGSFNMKINSPEYYNALKDYNITISNGFLFNKSDIFSQYINEIYEIKCSSDKESAMYVISKLLMNSLYGRFAMKPITSITRYIDRDTDIFNITDSYEILDYQEIDKTTILLTYQPINIDSDEECDEFGNFKNCIAIASAITSYSRVFMSKFKDDNLYYTDTDSIFTDKELDKSLIGKELGKFKLEYKLKEAVFLGPKNYAGETEDGKFVCKIKGYKGIEKPSLESLIGLLTKDSILKKEHVKWFRDVEKSEILMKDQDYTIKINDNKRDFVYDINNKAIDTQAIKLLNNHKTE